jgi:NAD(P)-dependent dehydrogenase (short-subunit alcohol dehydrogenase family)
MRAIEAFQDLAAPDGLIGAMTSGQGSIANNTTGSREVYRGSKAALNQFMRSFAVRQADTARSLLLMAPGWIKTDLGGDDAPFTIEENVPKVVDVMLAKRSVPGLEFLDFRGDTVPW